MSLHKKYQEMVWWKINHPDLKLKIQKMQQNLDKLEKEKRDGIKKSRSKGTKYT